MRNESGNTEAGADCPGFSSPVETVAYRTTRRQNVCDIMGPKEQRR